MIPEAAMPVVHELRKLFKDAPEHDPRIEALHMVTLGIGMMLGHLMPKFKDHTDALAAFRFWVSEQDNAERLVQELLG